MRQSIYKVGLPTLHMELKGKVIKTLRDFGRISTSRVSAIVGMNWVRANKVLKELVKEKKIKKTQETHQTFWEIQND